jgi:isocitrate dehydrogenase
VSGLPWVRMDTGLPSHPKMLNLLNDPSSKRYQAAASVGFAICWSGEHGTDGHIPFTALPFIHATKTTAALLVKHGFWEPLPDGWRIHNFAIRQELAIVTATKKEAQRVGALMANCKRWHGESCGCWQDKAAVKK